MSELRKTEFHLQYVARKLLFLLLNVVCIYGAVRCVKNRYNDWTYQQTILLFVIAVLLLYVNKTLYKMFTSYMCVPKLCNYYNRQELEEILHNENFKKIPELNGTIWENKMYRSEHFIKINYTYIAINLCTAMWRKLIVIGSGGSSIELNLIYMTGDRVKIDLGGREIAKESNVLFDYFSNNFYLIWSCEIGLKQLNKGLKQYKNTLKTVENPKEQILVWIQNERELKEQYVKDFKDTFHPRYVYWETTKEKKGE
ncbi:MAG: hypothetical protein PHW34_08395 [Hespellia sp.]|nr:hypothetical protein [Hespellia sp.]